MNSSQTQNRIIRWSGRGLLSLILSLVLVSTQTHAMASRAVPLSLQVAMSSLSKGATEDLRLYTLMKYSDNMTEKEASQLEAMLVADPDPALAEALGPVPALVVSSFASVYAEANGTTVQQLREEAAKIHGIKDDAERAKAVAAFQERVTPGILNMTMLLTQKSGVPEGIVKMLPELLDPALATDEAMQAAFVDRLAKFDETLARDAAIVFQQANPDPSQIQRLCGPNVGAIILGILFAVAGLALIIFATNVPVPVCDVNTGACAVVPGWAGGLFLLIVGIASIAGGASSGGSCGGAPPPPMCQSASFTAPYSYDSGSGAGSGSGYWDSWQADAWSGYLGLGHLGTTTHTVTSFVGHEFSVDDSRSAVAVNAKLKDLLVDATATPASQLTLRLVFEVLGDPAPGSTTPTVKCTGRKLLRRDAGFSISLDYGRNGAIPGEVELSCAFRRTPGEGTTYKAQVTAYVESAVLRQDNALNSASFEGTLLNANVCAL